MRRVFSIFNFRFHGENENQLLDYFAAIVLDFSFAAEQHDDPWDYYHRVIAQLGNHSKVLDMIFENTKKLMIDQFGPEN
jgi:hypothetical protein